MGRLKWILRRRVDSASEPIQLVADIEDGSASKPKWGTGFWLEKHIESPANLVERGRIIYGETHSTEYLINNAIASNVADIGWMQERPRLRNIVSAFRIAAYPNMTPKEQGRVIKEAKRDPYGWPGETLESGEVEEDLLWIWSTYGLEGSPRGSFDVARRTFEELYGPVAAQVARRVEYLRYRATDHHMLGNSGVLYESEVYPIKQELVALGDPACEGVTRLLEDSNFQLRELAVEILVASRHKVAIEPIVQAFVKDPAAFHSDRLLAALVSLGASDKVRKQAADAIISCLDRPTRAYQGPNDEAWYQTQPPRMLAAQLLGMLGGSFGVDRLIEWAQDEDDDVAREARQVLAKLGIEPNAPE